MNRKHNSTYKDDPQFQRFLSNLMVIDQSQIPCNPEVINEGENRKDGVRQILHELLSEARRLVDSGAVPDIKTAFDVIIEKRIDEQKGE